jgi:hypothetical protein
LHTTITASEKAATKKRTRAATQTFNHALALVEQAAAIEPAQPNFRVPRVTIEAAQPAELPVVTTG